MYGPSVFSLIKKKSTRVFSFYFSIGVTVVGADQKDKYFDHHRSIIVKRPKCVDLKKKKNYHHFEATGFICKKMPLLYEEQNVLFFY